jgi:ABC-type multidrug transport system ATPase subunit/ABC-type multidrug transport system permease subunit
MVQIADDMIAAPGDELIGRRHAGSVLEALDVHYTVPVIDNNKEKSATSTNGVTAAPTTRTLLNHVHCTARPGEILGVMGSSGAGKSTLLDVLAGRLISNDLTGQIRVNGKEVTDRRAFRKETGYVMQSDALFPLLTVRETIRYAAYLRVAEKSIEEKEALAEMIIKLLRLQKCADTIIGDEEKRGLSGGEKRRVSIAVDIVHFPAIIFLDEPTSGLDSTTAQSVIESLKLLCMKLNCTVLLTIHQPSMRLFQSLDRVMFLVQGRVSYLGETSGLYDYTRSLYQLTEKGNNLPVANPPEVFLDLLDDLAKEGNLQKAFDFHDKQKVLTRSNTSAEDGMTSSKKQSLVLASSKNTDVTYANNLWMEAYFLLHRMFRNIVRTPELFIARLVTHIFFGILVGTLWLKTEDTDEGFGYRAAYQVMTIAMYMWTSLEALPIFFNQREIFKREYSSGAYRAGSFAWTALLIQLPFLLILSCIYATISYWLINMPPQASTFFFHLFANFTIMTAAHSFSTMLSVLLPNPMTAQTVGSAVFAVMFLFSGYFIKRSSIPHYWLWMHYLSLFKYGYDSEMINSIKDHGHTIDMTNTQLLKYYSVDGMNVGMGVGILWAWIVFYRLIFHYRLVTAFSGARTK